MRNVKRIRTIWFTFLLTIISYSNNAQATCGGVYKVTAWETLKAGDVIFITDLPSDNERGSFRRSIAFEDKTTKLKVKNVIKGNIKPNQLIDIEYLAINRGTSVPVGGPFSSLRNDGLVVASYSNTSPKHLVAIKLPKIGCSKLMFKAQELIHYRPYIDAPATYIKHLWQKTNQMLLVFSFFVFVALSILVKAVRKRKHDNS